MNDVASGLPYFTGDAAMRRPWLVAFSASSGVYVGLAVLALLVGSAARVVQQTPVDLTFIEKVVKPEPPPIPEVKPPPAPVVPKNLKVRKLDAPPPPKELVAPKEMPKAPAPEADPSQDKGVAVYGDGGEADPAGLEGGSRIGGAIALPEDADPPTPVKNNVLPVYPQEARATGKTGMVIVKVVILADGRVADVKVMRGDEPFVSAALAAVKTWKYDPARYKGQAITVYRIIQIPFKLNA